MSIASDLISKGYFPQELPPPFATSSLEQYVTTKGISTTVNQFCTNTWSEPVKHSLARAAGLRRQLSIPNPANYISLAELIDSNWSRIIDPILSLSTIGSSRPVPSTGPRAIESVHQKLAEQRAYSRNGARYLLKADIQNFYPSLYTHCIPWALHTKPIAKAHIRDKTLVGNKIDLAVRSGQMGQTVGVPIGPDTSRILAEVVMSVVEAALKDKIHNRALKGHRNYDDFELCFGTMAEAEAGLYALQEVLGEFELTLNPRKCEIVELPNPIEPTGFSELSNWNFRSSPASQRADVISYFDRLAQLMISNRGDPIASYGIACLRTRNFLPSTSVLLESYLLQMIVSEPACTRFAVGALCSLISKGHSISKNAISDTMERLSLRHAPLGHGSEIAWVLWLCIAARVNITQETSDAVSKMEDSIVALLALHANSLSLVTGHLDTSLWNTSMNAAGLKGKMWLLSYEAGVKGWLPSIGNTNHISAEPFFADLSTHNVEFYDRTKTIPAPPTLPPSAIGGGGGVGSGPI